LKIIREKRTEGISLASQSFFSLGVALWAVYGLWLHNWPLLLANITTLFFSLSILFLKIRYSSGPQRTHGGSSGGNGF